MKLEIDQFISPFSSCLLRKFGVASYHLSRPFKLVFDALSGSVPAGEKLKIFQPVVVLDPVDVMHRLVRVKPSIEMFFHHVPVLKNVTRRLSLFARHNHSDVTVASDSFRGLLVRIFCLVRQPSKLRSAFGAAQTFAAVYGASGAPLNVHPFSALDAGRVPGFFREPSAQPAAFGRAVHRVLAELLAIGSDVARLVFERRSTYRAVEFRTFNNRVLASEDSFVRDLARSTAEFLGRVLRFNFEVLTAASANLLDWHPCNSCLVGAGRFSTSCRSSKEEK